MFVKFADWSQSTKRHVHKHALAREQPVHNETIIIDRSIIEDQRMGGGSGPQKTVVSGPQNTLFPVPQSQ